MHPAYLPIKHIYIHPSICTSVCARRRTFCIGCATLQGSTRAPSAAATPRPSQEWRAACPAHARCWQRTTACCRCVGELSSGCGARLGESRGRCGCVCVEVLGPAESGSVLKRAATDHPQPVLSLIGTLTLNPLLLQLLDTPAVVLTTPAALLLRLAPPAARGTCCGDTPPWTCAVRCGWLRHWGSPGVTSCLTCGPWPAPLPLSDKRAACWCHMLVGEGCSGSLRVQRKAACSMLGCVQLAVARPLAQQCTWCRCCGCGRLLGSCWWHIPYAAVWCACRAGLWRLALCQPPHHAECVLAAAQTLLGRHGLL
jgi:hypothetical protein